MSMQASPKPSASHEPVLHHALREDFSVYRPAGPILRWYALAIDVALIGPLDVLIHLPFRRTLERLEAYGHTLPYALLAAFLTLAPVMIYLIGPTMAFGQTLGKKTVGLRVVRTDYGSHLSFRTVLLREIIGKFLTVASLGYGILLMAFGGRYRALHDRISGTEVIVYRDP